MNFLILGDGPEERAWAEALAARSEHRVVAAAPGFPDLFPDLSVPADLEAALAVPGIEAAIVGGPIEARDEALRRTAASGFAAICLHPPGDNADPYYQVALSREETGAVVVPDLPGRLHPGVGVLRRLLPPTRPETFPSANPSIIDLHEKIHYSGRFRGASIEATGRPEDRTLLDSFARWVDVIRALIGEVESLTALGDPPGGSPERSLTVQFRGRAGRSAELRLFPPDARRATRIAMEFEREDLSLEMPAGPSGPSILSYRSAKGDLSEDLPPSDPHEAVLDVLGRAVEGRPARPDLLDGTRAMELRSAAARSLRRGRAVDLHYEEVSEANNFKTVMTSVGCMVLLGCLVALPAALVGPALGVGQTIYIAYAIPPLLVVFALLQVLRLAVKPPAPGGKGSSEET